MIDRKNEKDILTLSKIVILFALLFFPLTVFAQETRDTAFERINRSGVIRCGYAPYPPYLIKDLETGKMSGIYAEIFEEVARQADLKIDWAEEVTMENMFAGLENRRYDVLCTPITYTVAYARQALFIPPFIYVPFYVYARKDDPRFLGADGQKKLNDPETSFIAIDGDLTSIFAKEYFPLARLMSAGGMPDASQLYLSVVTGKADAVIGEPVFAKAFMSNNPDKIVQVPGAPVRVVPATVAVAIGEHDLQSFLGTSFTSLSETGFIEKIIRKNIPNASDLMWPAAPYRHD